MEKFRRQQEIELTKVELDRIEQNEKLMAEAIAQAKRSKNVEILQFNDYMHRARSDQIECQIDRTDWIQAKRANDQFEVNAEMERQKMRQLLYAEQRVCDIIGLKSC